MGRAPRARGEGLREENGSRWLRAGRGEGRSRGVCLWKGKAGRKGTRVKKRGEGKVGLRESSARCQQKGETKPAGQSEEGESGKPKEGKEVGKEEGKAGGFRGRSRCNFCGRLSRRSRRGKRRIQSQSVRQAAAGGGERRRIKDGHQPLRGTATAPHFPGWSLRGGPALMERRNPRSAEAEAAAAGTQRGGGGRRGGAGSGAGEGRGGGGGGGGVAAPAA